MSASLWEISIQIIIVLTSALILGGLLFRFFLRLSESRKTTFVIEEDLYKLTTTPALMVERVILREQKGAEIIQLILRNTGSLLSLVDIVPLEGNEVVINYLPHAENDQSMPEDYPQGTSMTLFLKGESIREQKYKFCIVFQALDGEQYWQEISGVGNSEPNIDTPQLYHESDLATLQI